MKNKPVSPQFPDITTAWRALVLLAVYHMSLGLALVSIQWRENPLSTEITDPTLFASVSWFFVAFSPVALLLALRRKPAFRSQVHGILTIDVIAMLVLMNASGGVHSGVGLLLALSLAIGSLLTSGNATFFFAALAASGTIGLQGWAHFKGTVPLWDSIYALILGMAFFVIAFLVHALTTRLKAAERAIEIQAAGLADLHEVNAYVIEHLDTGILVIDAQDRVLMHNKSAQRLLSDKPIRTRASIASVDTALHMALTHWKSREMPSDPIELTDHSPGDIVIRFQPLSQDGYRGALISLEDKERARTEAHKIQLAALGRVTASIAHEIRNPLSAIRQAARMLSEASGSGAHYQQLAEVIERNSIRLDNTVENVLRLANPAGSPQRELLALCAFVGRLAHEMAQLPFTSRAEIGVTCLSEPTACIDPRHLEQIMLTLCENAVRHGPEEQGKTKIDITISDGDNGTPTISVADSGHGVPPELSTKIFEPFYSTAGSTGLGLYLVRTLCEANGGQIGLQPNNKGQGATFVITLASDTSSRR